MYALMPWMQKYRVFDAPSKVGEQDLALDEDDFSALGLDKVPGESYGEHERSSFLVTPALLKKSYGRAASEALGTLKMSVYSARSESAALQKKVEALEASKQSADAENEMLRRRIAELERILANSSKEASDSKETGLSVC